MSYRPGTVKKDIILDLPYPRDPTSPEFNKLKQELTHLVMEEQNRFETAQLKGSTGD